MSNKLEFYREWYQAAQWAAEEVCANCESYFKGAVDCEFCSCPLLQFMDRITEMLEEE